MAKVELCADPLSSSTSSAKLPALHEGRCSLVSGVQTGQAPSPRERALGWAADIRNRIDASKEEKDEVGEEDVASLKHELIQVFICSLQQDSRMSWIFLQEVLELLPPYRECLRYWAAQSEFHHYLERIVSHVESHKERFFDLQLVDALSKVFPEELELLRRRGAFPAKLYCSPGVKSVPHSPRKSSSSVVKLRLPDGTNPYSAHVLNEEEMMPSQKLTIGDLGHSLGDVALEMAARESIWSHCLGTTALALSTHIPQQPKSPSPPSSFRSRSVSQSVTSPRDSEKKTPRKDVIQSIQEEYIPTMNGREAVEYFARCHHIGQIKSIHFNLSPSRHYRPYDLISVQKNKANSEHYVFSTFGVLHVYEHLPNESLTLGEWQREAVLWKALSSIPFFKNYLIKKMFDRWRTNKLYLDYLRRQEMIANGLLHNIPAFGAGLLQVSRLLKEVITINFLPFETDKTYQLGEYENSINYKNIQADKLLERFFSYCKVVVEVTAEESFKKLRYCEEQVKKKTFFSKDSLHLQRTKKEQREENLRIAKSETGRLGNFVKLVDQLIVEHMFHVTKTQVISFVEKVLCISDAPRDGFFKANLVFTKHEVLGLSPSKERFQKALTSTLRGIPSVLCAKAVPMDGSVPEHDVTDEADPAAKSYDSTHRPSDAKPSSVTDGSKISAKSIAGTSQVSSVRQETRSQTLATVSESSRRCSKGSQFSQGEGSEIEVTEKETGLDPNLLEDPEPLPNLPKHSIPQKEDDDLGVATPDLVVMKADEGLLMVEGEGFMGQYSPLSRASLEEKLAMDSEFQEVLKRQSELMGVAMEEVEQYCEFNKWLNEIHQYCHKWNNMSVKEFKGAAAFAIEQKLTELRQWSEKVRNFDKSFVTENGLLYVDCSAIHEGLLPRLDDVYQELITFVSDEARNLARSFCEEMVTVIQNMKDKRSTVDAFAVFAKNFSQYKKNTITYQQRVEYIKSLYEVIRMSYRQLYPEEEKLEEQVWASWEAFLMEMQEASEFVNIQTPLMTQQLEDTYQRLEKAAKELSEEATSGIFLDPDNNPMKILRVMKGIREKFFSVQSQLKEASKWREAICGEPYDLKFLNKMTVEMDVRQQLWRYVEVSTSSIKEWKQMLFKKMHIKKSLEKVMEWQSAAAQLKPHVPYGDRVLSTWFTTLQEFKKDLPLLHRLSNEALKERHWKAIFLGMNEPYDPTQQFLVSDLLSYSLVEHADLIQSVFLSAINEYDLELKFGKIRKFWEAREFKLAKHIPDSLFVKEPTKRTSSLSRRHSKLERYRQERAALAAGTLRGLDVASDDFYTLIEVEELKYQLEDSRISLDAMACSPYLGDMEETVTHWCRALRQVDEITDLWLTSQRKWLYLLKIFEKPELYRKFSGQATKFEEQVHNQFKDWMRVVSNDSSVMSVVGRKWGEKGYRFLQGNNLRSMLLSLIHTQEEILKDINVYIEKSRTQFPRLYFLSDQEMVDMSGISRNPKALIPYVRRCFPGIQNLIFALPPEITSLNSTLDFALNADKLQVVSVVGNLGEEVPLYAKLDSFPQATKWLRSLENLSKNTMTVMLQACVQARMEEGSRQPIQILEELAQLSDTTPPQRALQSEMKQTFRHWLLQFPIQCVLVSEAIIWERGVARILEKPDPDDLKLTRSNMCAKLDQYVDILKETSTNEKLSLEMRERLQCLLTSLIKQTLHHRDITDGLLQCEIPSETSFDWLKSLRYRMDIRNVLRAKTVVTEMQNSVSGRASKPVNRRSLVSVTAEEPPKMTRTRTTVSTDYQFSPCYIQQLGHNFYYDYEYLGPQHSLVLTPLTERAFLSLTQATKNFHCGALVGPAGSGKSETVRELARMLGRTIFTINCNENLTLAMMLQLMTGMVQSGCWALFDNTDRLTTGLMSVTAQQLDYLRTALRTLDLSSENQYKIRGQPRFDKLLSLKVGAGDKVIRRNSLTTLHPLPRAETSPPLERQKTVPHGFNEKGLVTYFEDTWIAERERRRRHSIEKEVEIKESQFYKSNKPPPLFYEHVKKKKKSAPDYKQLIQEPTYVHRIVGNVMFNGKLIPASANYGCFMTLSQPNVGTTDIPENFQALMRPCALVIPDTQQIIEVTLCCHGYEEFKTCAQKMMLFLKLMKIQLPRQLEYNLCLREVKKILMVAVARIRDKKFLHEAPGQESENDWKPSAAEQDVKLAEEHSIVYAIREVVESRIQDGDDRAQFYGLLRDVFPVTASAQMDDTYMPHEPKLISAIREQLKEDNMKENEELITKILQLHTALELKQPVILTGQAGSGKSTCSTMLARAINFLNYKLFAPDHSKDELTTDRDLVFQYKTQKLQDGEEVDELEEEFLQNIDEDLKQKKTKGSHKMRLLHMNLLATKEIFDDVKRVNQEEKEKMMDCAKFPKVDLIRLLPTVMPPSEMFGHFENGLWHGGIMSKIASDSYAMSLAVRAYIDAQKVAEKRNRHQTELPSVLLRWLVMDGDLDAVWADGLKTLLDEEHKLSVANGEQVKLRDTTAFIFESPSLVEASPGAIARCTVVHCAPVTVSWEGLIHQWKQTAKTKWVLTSACMKILDDLVKDVFPPTVKFLASECCPALLTDVGVEKVRANQVVPGVQEVTMFLNMLKALFDKMFLREELDRRVQAELKEEDEQQGGSKSSLGGAPSRQMASRMTTSSHIEVLIPGYTTIVKGMFAFAYIWSFGGSLHDRFRERFSKFAHDVLYRASHPIRLPVWGQVFDYCLDETSGTFTRWGQRQQEKVRSLGGFVFTPEVDRYNYLLELFVSAHLPVLLTGAAGVGKTALIKHLVLPKQTSTTAMMSRGMTSAIFQDMMVDHIVQLKNKAMDVVGAPGSLQAADRQRHLFFVDDLNMAQRIGSYQPPLEVLRQILTTGGVYDRQRQRFQGMEEATFVAACTTPSSPGTGLGHACHVMSSRLTRLFINLCVFCPSMENLVTIYSRQLQPWLEEFPTYTVEHHYEFGQAMIVGLVELYQSVRDKLRPTPAHAHYVFSLHDISRVVQGILLMSPRSRIRKLRTKKKDKEESKSKTAAGRQTSFDSSQSYTVSQSSLAGGGRGEQIATLTPAAPMMKVITQLWCHECCRTFSDRLISSEDQLWFSRTLEEAVVKHFCSPRDSPATEMAAITEETQSQFGRSTPTKRGPHCTPPPGTPSDIDDDLDPYDDESGDKVMMGVDNTGEDGISMTSMSLGSQVQQQSSSESPSRGYQGQGQSSESPQTDSTSQTNSSARDTSMDVTTELETTQTHTDGGEVTETETAGEVDHGSAEHDEVTDDSDNTEDSTEESDMSDETSTYGTPSDVGELVSKGKVPGLRLTAAQRRASRESSFTSAQDRQQQPPELGRISPDHEHPDGPAPQPETRSDPMGQVTSGRSSVGSVTGGRTPSLRRQVSRTGITKRGVTFKAGLIADKEYEAFYGALMSLEEIKGGCSNVTDFIFSKFFMSCHTEAQGQPVEKGYMESTEEGLREALATCLAEYNTGTWQRLEVVFFTEAINHAARLSRILAHPGGHGLLLGMSYCTGRATLARLAAYIAHCKVYEPKPQTDRGYNLTIVREHIKRSCQHAGVVGKPAVLLIHEDLGTACLQDISTLMAEGTSPGLYSDAEVQKIVSQMMPGGVQTKRVDKIEQAFDRYIKRIKQNLHIIVCLNYKGNSYSTDFHSLHEKVNRYPGLLKHCVSIDLFLPWSYQAFTTVAWSWLEDEKSKIVIPWNPARREEQITMASNAMAYIHLSAKSAVERHFCHQREPLRFYTPLTFMEFVHLFKVVAAYVVKRERVNIVKYEKALGKIDEAFGSIAEYKREVSDLTPQHKLSMETIRELVEQVEQHKEEYIQSLDKCKEQEEEIMSLQGPLETMRRSAQTEFDKVNPSYQAAQAALCALSKNDIDELKSYREPPDVIKFVINALCLLFRKKHDWEEGKLLLIRDNFLQELIFYDKDHVPDDIFKDLRFFIEHPLFVPVNVTKVSKAGESICLWVHAVYRYSAIHRSMQPHLHNLHVAEERFTKAQARLGHLRVEANRIKSGLERKITLHRAALKKAKTIEKHIMGIEKKIARASNLMENMSMQHFLWRSELKKAKRHVRSAPGDALITAACVCYHGPLDDKYRSELMEDWLSRCRQGTFDATSFHDRDPYSVTARLEFLLQSSHNIRHVSSLSDFSDSDSISSDITATFTTTPQVRTFKYMPAVYDSSKYYKSELKKQDTMESVVPNIEFDDSDDEEEQSPLLTRSSYTLQDILSDFDELSGWRMTNLPTDLHSVQNALLMRVSCYKRKHCWPLLVDPDNQAEMWVKVLQRTRMLFGEADSVEGDNYMDGMPIEAAFESAADTSEDSSGQMEPPPSRGTALTFSDVTEFTLPDTSTVYTARTQNSAGWQSHGTGDSEELRPVTSVTNSWETFSLQADNSIDHPEHNLWIIEADDPHLNSRLINAIVHGVTVLVTHLERKPLDPLFRGLLLKHFYVDKDGNKVVRVGDMIFNYHPNFCLYLSTTVPLFLKGDGLHSFPVHRLCCINMAVSDEAIINRLLFETMKIERKEYEGQKRSNENDIILHRQQLAKEHEAIREKTLNLDGPLLEDKTMLDSLLACQSNVEKNRIILEETRYMGDHLEGKFAEYIPMMRQSTMIYNTLQKMSVLHSCYYIPFYKFVDIFSSMIRSRDRGKGSHGDPRVRALELSNATMSEIFHHASMMMFEQHYNLLCLLVSLERMLRARKASSKEISLFINGFEKFGLDEHSLAAQKPSWIADKSWVDCNVLESLHHPFHGLCHSLLDNPSQWEEYFTLPISLVNPVPGRTLQELSLFQKCLLWKFCCPHRIAELSRAVVTYELGSVVGSADHYNIRDVYNLTNQFTPTVFLLPTTPKIPEWEGTGGYPYVSPAHEVKRLAREVGMDGKLRVMNFGVESQITEVKHAIEDCLQSGYWLLLQNYHLAGDPDSHFFSLLKDIIYSKWIAEDRQRENTDISDEGRSLIARSRPSTQIHDQKIHPQFRLWITTLADGPRVIPGVLIQHGLRVTCEAKANFRSCLQKSYRSVAFLLKHWHRAEDDAEEKFGRTMPLALMHSLLLQHSYYGNHAFVNHHSWNLMDLAMAVDIFKRLVHRTSSSAHAKDLIGRVYSDHCTDMCDSQLVQELVSCLAKYASDGKRAEKETANGKGVVSLLHKLLASRDDPPSLKKALDAIEDHSARTFSLSHAAEQHLLAGKSRIIGKDMVQATGAPELLLQVLHPPKSTTVSTDPLIPQLIALTQNCPTLPETSREQIYPIDIFLHYEITGFRDLVSQVQSDLNLLLKKARGEVALTEQVTQLFDDVCNDRVPSAWLKETFPSCSSLKQWLRELPVRMAGVVAYLKKTPAMCNLSHFLRPDRFLDAVLQTYARKQFKDINKFHLQVQVMPSGLCPSAPPPAGVFITCLQLCNASWDGTRAAIMEPIPGGPETQQLPPVWFKPIETNVQTSDSQSTMFPCPLFLSSNPELHGHSSVVHHVSLPTVEEQGLWIQKRVYMLSHT
ncbi:dynein heavy chain domain-containing protein 1-like [Haliotis rufescens]|uniref:dynein heavy chain domain-containing protein 1-like n=1 Tax=Haliotis rufescens TaxID=6454 RepID=UPI00201ED741|nr:dynein heavy chain domain-containing protein 1-like [Haliotis rufescens]